MERLWQTGIRGIMWRVVKKNIGYVRSAMMLGGGKSKYFDISGEVAQGRTFSPALFNVFINDLRRTIQVEKEGVKVRENVIPGLMFAGDFVGISKTPNNYRSR